MRTFKDEFGDDIKLCLNSEHNIKLSVHCPHGEPQEVAQAVVISPVTIREMAAVFLELADEAEKEK